MELAAADRDSVSRRKDRIMATDAPDAPNPEDALEPGEVGRIPIPAKPALAASRNLLPSFVRKGAVGALSDDDGGDDYVPAFVDIDEPLSIVAGESKVVDFQYNPGIPQATAFGITWHATEADADARQNILQDEPLPVWLIDPQTPHSYTGQLEPGTVNLQAPANMRAGIIWGNMAIYQISPASTTARRVSPTEPAEGVWDTFTWGT